MTKQPWEIVRDQQTFIQDAMRGAKKVEAIPEYDGSICTSRCGNDIDCPHGEDFDQDHGIVRSGLDFDVKSDRTETHFAAVYDENGELDRSEMDYADAPVGDNE